MRVSSWAPPVWESLFFIACGVYENYDWDSQLFRKKTLDFFTLYLRDFLPCSLCRSSSGRYINILDLEKTIMKGKKYQLLLFLYELKIMVDAKLILQGEKSEEKVQSNLPTFEDVAHKFLSQSSHYSKELVTLDLKKIYN